MDFSFIKNIDKKILYPIAIIAVAVLLFIILVTFSTKGEQGEITEKAWSVETINAQYQSASPNVVLYGTIESPRNTKLEAAVLAYVAETPVLQGERVAKGQLLISLDDSDAKLVLQDREAAVADLEAQIQNELNRAESDRKSLEHEKELVEIRKRQVNRLAELYRKQVGSAEALDQAKQALSTQSLSFESRQLAVKDHASRLAQLKAKLAKAKANLDDAKLDMQRTKVVAPFPGRISKLNVAVGDRVQEGETLIEMFDTSVVEIRAQIPTLYIPSVRESIEKGEKPEAKATIDGTPVVLKLVRLAGEISRGRGGLDGYFRVIEGTKDLVLGRSVEMIITLQPVENVLVVPSSAIYGHDRIYKVAEQRMAAIKVQRLGTITNPDGSYLVLIRSDDIANGDAIVTTQLPNARSGLKVDIAK